MKKLYKLIIPAAVLTFATAAYADTFTLAIANQCENDINVATVNSLNADAPMTQGSVGNLESKTFRFDTDGGIFVSWGHGDGYRQFFSGSELSQAHPSNSYLVHFGPTSNSSCDEIYN